MTPFQKHQKPLLALFNSGFHVITLSLLVSIANGQSLDWTWMRGDTIQIATATYGTQGVANASNDPSGRIDAMTWTDSAGNLWLFGGQGYNATATFGYLNDLWKYNPNSNEWTWVDGSTAQNVNGSYGTLGIANASNVPGSRAGGFTWSDSTHLWLFGGYGYGASSAAWLNDLWKYNLNSGEWTWVGGSNQSNEEGTFGTIGSATASNYPGARETGVSWIDTAGNFWLFGGNGKDGNGSTGRLNDLWKFDVDSNQWTWMKGDSVINQSGSYGTQGTSSALNKPGSREYSTSWTDGNGNFWLFGGVAYDASGTYGNLNDLWRYNPSTNNWTWVSGANIWGTSANNDSYGIKGVTSPSNRPGNRWGAKGGLLPDGNLMLFGGYGNAFASVGELNDLWTYDIVTGYWTWMKGSKYGSFGQAYPVYGTQGVSDPANTSGSKNRAASWSIDNGDFWVFGGYGAYTQWNGGYPNDIWVNSFCGEPDSTTIIETACDSLIWLDGNTYSSSNNSASYIETNSIGCDSILLLDLTVNYSNSFTDIVAACDSFTWIDSVTYYANNSAATYVLTNTAGCDSVVSLDLIINASDSVTQSEAVCDSYVWAANNNTYTQSGVYIETLTNGSNCDSVVTLNLTIYPTDSIEEVVNACDQYTWSTTNITYSSSGVHTTVLSNQNGCDSVVSLVLSIQSSDSITQSINACGSYVWDVNNTQYTQSGIYIETFTNVENCDSVLTLDLTILPSDSVTQSVEACKSYKWPANEETYTESGLYTESFVNATGCDSLVVLDLTIFNVDTSISINYPSIISDADSNEVEFQWLDCNNSFTPIFGSTSPSYIPAVLGSYAVEVSSENCTDTSRCVEIDPLSISKLTPSQIRVYPNPFQDEVIIEYPSASKLEVRLMDQTGRLLKNQSTNSNALQLTTGHLPAGMYLVHITGNQRTECFKLIKQ